MTVSGQLESVKLRIEAYGDQVRRWHEIQALTVQCLEFELLLQHGLALLRQVNEADEKWRSAVLKGEIAYDQSFEEELTKFYQRWIASGEVALNELAGIESTGLEVDHATEFRRACSEVRGMLTDDAEFFSGSTLAELKDQAVDEFRAGQCEQF